MADKQILGTLTGEHFQPVRLHYRVLNQQGVLRAFKKLRCVDHDPTKQDFSDCGADGGARARQRLPPTPSRLREGPVILGHAACLVRRPAEQ